MPPTRQALAAPATQLGMIKKVCRARLWPTLTPAPQRAGSTLPIV